MTQQSWTCNVLNCFRKIKTLPLGRKWPADFVRRPGESVGNMVGHLCARHMLIILCVEPTKLQIHLRCLVPCRQHAIVHRMSVLQLTKKYHAVIFHDVVIKRKHFPRYWPFVRGIHRSSVNSPQIGQWSGALMFSLICAWICGCANNRYIGDLRRHRAHHDVILIHDQQHGYMATDHLTIHETRAMESLILTWFTLYNPGPVLFHQIWLP